MGTILNFSSIIKNSLAHHHVVRNVIFFFNLPLVFAPTFDALRVTVPGVTRFPLSLRGGGLKHGKTYSPTGVFTVGTMPFKTVHPSSIINSKWRPLCANVLAICKAPSRPPTCMRHRILHFTLNILSRCNYFIYQIHVLSYLSLK